MATNETPQQDEQPHPQDGPAGGGFSISGKMLGIVGGGAAALVVVIVVIVVVVLAATGVFSGGGSVLGYIPGDAGLVTIGDVRTQTNSDGLEDYVEFIQDGGGDPRDTKDIGMDDDNIEIFAVVYESLGGNDTLWIAKGDFEFDDIRDELDDGLDCEDDDYRGFEMWECPGRSFPAAVAIFEKNGYVVIASQDQSDLERLLTYMVREPEQLANAPDSDIRRILNTVGDGWLRIAAVDDCPVDRCQGSGLALQGEDSDSIDVSFALMFGSERAAEAMKGEIGIDDYITTLLSVLALDLDIGNVKADGEFVVGDGVAEFVDQDEPRSSNRSSGGGSARPAATAAPPWATPTAILDPIATPTAIPGRPVATATAKRAIHEAVGRDEWIEDCSGITLEQTNQYLARHEQITRNDAYEHCECLHDYVQEWEGPPPATMSDLAAGRLGADALSFVDVLSDAGSYCAGW